MAKITSNYEVRHLRILQAHLQTIQMQREKTNNTFIFFLSLEDTEIFPKLLV